MIAERRPVWIIAAMLLAFVVATGTPAPSAQAAFPGRNGRIAYTDTRCGTPWIATMKPDGTRQRQLKINGLTCADLSDDAFHRTNYAASWAPDGQRLLFAYTESSVAVADPRRLAPQGGAGGAGRLAFLRAGRTALRL